MSLLWGWLSKYALVVGATVGGVLLLALGAQTWRLDTANRHLTELQNLRTLEKAQSTAVALETTTKYRTLELQMQAQSEKAERTYHAAQSRNESTLAAARGDAGRLRDQLAAYASGRGAATVDTQSAASRRALAIGDVLATVLRDAAVCANDAESQADGVRALKAAWPTSAILPPLKLGPAP